MKTLNKTEAKIKNYLKCPICNNLKKKKLVERRKLDGNRKLYLQKKKKKFTNVLIVMYVF